jgi:Domain of unknown function (DUF4470)
MSKFTWHGASMGQVLLLGCGDIRNLLWTGNGATAHIHFHLNDYNAGVLARNLLLLHILEHMELDKRDDLHYLWNVWYNVFWDTATKERFIKDVQAILESGVLDAKDAGKSASYHFHVEDEALALHLNKLLQWWTSEGLVQPFKTLQKTRSESRRVLNQPEYLANISPISFWPTEHLV